MMNNRRRQSGQTAVELNNRHRVKKSRSDKEQKTLPTTTMAIMTSQKPNGDKSRQSVARGSTSSSTITASSSVFSVSTAGFKSASTLAVPTPERNSNRTGNSMTPRERATTRMPPPQKQGSTVVGTPTGTTSAAGSAVTSSRTESTMSVSLPMTTSTSSGRRASSTLLTSKKDANATKSTSSSSNEKNIKNKESKTKSIGSPPSSLFSSMIPAKVARKINTIADNIAVQLVAKRTWDKSQVKQVLRDSIYDGLGLMRRAAAAVEGGNTSLQSSSKPMSKAVSPDVTLKNNKALRLPLNKPRRSNIDGNEGLNITTDTDGTISTTTVHHDVSSSLSVTTLPEEAGTPIISSTSVSSERTSTKSLVYTLTYLPADGHETPAEGVKVMQIGRRRHKQGQHSPKHPSPMKIEDDELGEEDSGGNDEEDDMEEDGVEEEEHPSEKENALASSPGSA